MLLSTIASSLFLAVTTLGTTPEATIRDVITAINTRDIKLMVAQFEVTDSDIEKTLREMFNRPHPERNTLFEVKSVEAKVSGDSAVAKVKIGGDKLPGSIPDETVNLKRVNGDWKISNAGANSSSGPGLFESLGGLMKSPKGNMLGAAQAAETTRILSNMKQLVVAVHLFAQDNNDKLLLNTSSLKAKLTRYTRTELLFQDGTGKPLGVVFNDALTGKRLADIREPNNTVLLSLGTRKALKYQGGRTPIGFVDGHAKRVTPAEAAKLKWLP